MRREHADGTEVDEYDRAVGPDKDVSRMRIGVVDAVDEDHSAVRRDDSLSERTAVETARGERLEIGDLRAVDELGRQHLPR